MFSKILTAATTLLAASRVQALDAELAFCASPDCQKCVDLTVPFNGCVDAEVAGLAVRCTPGGEGIVLDIILDNKCSGSPVFSDKFLVDQCHSIAIPETSTTVSFEVAQCSNGTSLKKLKL